MNGALWCVVCLSSAACGRCLIFCERGRDGSTWAHMGLQYF